MKICMVVPWFPSQQPTTLPARQGLFDFRQVMQLAARGHEFRVISVRWPGQSTTEIYNDKVQARRLSPCFVFPGIRYPVPRPFTFSAEIRRVCRDWRPDVLNYSHAIYLTALPALRLHEPVVPVIVSTDVFPGVSWFYGNKLVDTVGRCYTRQIVKRILHKADGIHLMNSQLMPQAGRIGFDAAKAFTITRGVDTAVFHPSPPPAGLRRSLGIEDDAPVVLYAGRLDTVKGVNYLLEAAARVLPLYPAARFLIAGDGGRRGEYEAYARALPPGAIFAGWRQDVPQLMNIADIFVLPSLSEGAANAVMEAGAAGLPVIASAVGEIPEIIVPGVTGELVAPKDVGAIAAALEKLLGNPALAREMGAAARRRIEAKYTWEQICRSVETEYQKVIDRYKKASA